MNPEVFEGKGIGIAFSVCRTYPFKMSFYNNTLHIRYYQ